MPHRVLKQSRKYVHSNRSFDTSQAHFNRVSNAQNAARYLKTRRWRITMPRRAAMISSRNLRKRFVSRGVCAVSLTPDDPQIKPLTEEEKQQKLTELREKIAAKRSVKAQQEAVEARANEAIRRKSGKVGLVAF